MMKIEKRKRVERKVDKKEIENIAKAGDTVEIEPVLLTVNRNDLLSSGSTLLNLACSDSCEGSFVKGKYHLLVGDSSSGKTFLSLTCLAEACLNKNFENYRLIYDDVEGGNLFNIERFFGRKLAEKIEPPKIDENGEPEYSRTVEDFYYNITDLLDEKEPFIYVLDSMDCLSSEAEMDKFEELKEANRKGKTTTGVYTDGKAKKNSGNLRVVVNRLRETGSILLIICQTRDKLGMGGKTRSGGHALRFYATSELWFSRVETIKKTINKRKREVGLISKVKIKKNRLTGQETEVEIPIYHGYGIDDIRSCINYLIDENYWEQKKQTIIASDFNIEATEEKLIQEIEEKGLQKELSKLCEKVWLEIRSELLNNRRRKYD